MKKILKYESKRKINKQRFQFFLHKGGAVHFFLILATTIYIIANSIKQIIDTINKNELTFIFATISLIAAIFALIAQMIKFCLDWKKFFSPVANVYEYKNKINKEDVLKIFFDKEAYKALTHNIRLELSGLELAVLQLFLAGKKYIDIADELGISEKSVNNALMRIRKKLKDKQGK